MEMGYRYELRTKSIEDGIVKRSDKGGHTFIEYQPGDGTRYVLCFTDLDELEGASRAANGGSGYFLVTSMADAHRVRSMCVGKDSFLHHGRIEDHLGTTTASAITLGEIIAHVTGCQAASREEFKSDS